MSIEIARFITKVLLPRRHPDIVRRQRLIDCLHQNVNRRAQFLFAAAGYGKTTLLVDFASDVNIPVCWYSVDSFDEEPRNFLEYIVESIRRRFPQFGQQFLSFLSTIDLTSWLSSVVAALVNEIHTAIPDFFILVLDDYHFVEHSPCVNSIVNLLLEKAPDNCHFIISSRTIPPLSVIPRLIFNRQAAVLKTEDLCFTSQEIRELFCHSREVELSLEDAEGLMADSGGWIAGITLALQSSWKSPLRPTMKAKGVKSQLFEYLASEVYVQQSREIQDFQLKTSVLAELEPQICDYLLGISSSQQFLDEIERRNLLIVRLSNENHCYRYHHILREFLKTTLVRQNYQQYVSLNIRAAEFYHRQERWGEAILHYQEARCFQGCARVIGQSGEKLLQAGRWRTLASWIEGLPEEILAEEPKLTIWLIQATLRLGEKEKALRLASEAIERFRGDGNEQWLAQAMVYRGAALRLAGYPREAIKDLRQGLKLSYASPGSVATLAEAHRQLGGAYGQQGEFSRAKRELKKSLSLYITIGDLFGISMTHNQLGIAYGELGNLANSAAHLESAKTGWEKLSNLSELALTLSNLGMLYYLQAERDLAVEALEKAIEIAKRGGLLQSEAWALVTLGDVKRDASEYDAALELYNEALDLANQAMEGYLVAYTTCAMGNTYRLMGQYKKAEVLIKQAIAMAEERGEHYELGLYLTSLGVLKYQEEKFEEATKLLTRACRFLCKSGNKREMAKAYLHLANVLFRRKLFSQATRHLEVASQVLAELGHDDFILPDAAVLSSLIQFAASKRIGGTRFIYLKDKLVAYQLLVSKPMSRGEQLSSRISLPEVKAYGFGQSVVFLEARKISDIEWRSRKAKEMLFYFLVHPARRTKEQILEALCPELSIANQNSSFHSTVYRLRRALYQGCLVYNDGWYQLHPEGRFWFDAEEFERMLKQANHLPQESEARLSCLENAVDLYKGPLLIDFYSEWCEASRLNFETKYVRALSSLAEDYAAKGKWERCIELLERILAVDEYNEEAYHELIKAYALLGDRASALRCYRHYSDIMGGELKAELSPKIAHLYHQILKSQRS